MQKKNIINIIFWATIALFIPFFGNIYVDGWNWGVGDFAFAWIFFMLLGFTFSFTTHKITHPTQRIIAGVAVILFFTFMWVMLATG